MDSELSVVTLASSAVDRGSFDDGWSDDVRSVERVGVAAACRPGGGTGAQLAGVDVTSAVAGVRRRVGAVRTKRAESLVQRRRRRASVDHRLC